MTEFLIAAVFIGSVVAWFVILMRGLWLAVEEHGWRAWLPWIAAAFLLASAALAYGISRDTDPYPGLLCLSGHQQWVIVSNGKTTTREKAWVCDQRESQ